MANVSEKVKQIRDALYGEEVRESIASGIESMNGECTEAVQGYETAITTANSAAQTASAAANNASSKAQLAQQAADNAQRVVDSFIDEIPIANTVSPGCIKAGGDITVNAVGVVAVPALLQKANTADVYNKSQADSLLNGKVTSAQANTLIDTAITAALKRIYPVGKIEITYTNANPSAYLGFGTWAQFAQGQTLIGVNTSDTDFNVPGKTGGSSSIRLAFENIGYHAYGLVGAAGEHNGVHDHKESNWQAVKYLPPYITVYFWRRTA